MNEPKTIRVRIAVAMTEDGLWGAHGSDDVSDERKADRAHRECAATGEKWLAWVEADVPLCPSSPVVVEGQVITPAREQ